MSKYAWTEPGAFPVAPGVHRIPLPLPMDGLRAVNAYVIEDAAGLTLIDSGLAIEESERWLVRGLAELGHSLDDVARFLVTHAHRDHYTQAVVLRDRLGVTVALGRGEQPSLDVLALDATERERQRVADLRRCGAASLIEQITASWTDEDFDKTMWRYPNTWIERDTDITVGGRTLSAIATPGHTSGHVVFRDAQAGLLFAGDHVLPSITPSIGFEAVPAASPLADYLHSLRILLTLPDTVLLPAHGAVTASVHERVEELLEHHRVRLDDAWRAVHDGAGTAMQAAQNLKWTRRELRFDDLSVFDRMLAVIETSAHLKVLVARGGLTTDTTEEAVRYLPVD